MEGKVRELDQRLTAIGYQLGAIKSSVSNPGDVAATLAEFVPVWEMLQPNERTRVVHLLIETADYDSRSGGLNLVFRVDGALPIPRSTRNN